MFAEISETVASAPDCPRYTCDGAMLPILARPGWHGCTSCDFAADDRFLQVAAIAVAKYLPHFPYMTINGS